MDHPSCVDHYDAGIFTIHPISNVPCLELWDIKNEQWVQIEKLYENRNDIWVIFTGSLWEQLTKGIALKHRVMKGPTGVSRYSINYMLHTTFEE